MPEVRFDVVPGLLPVLVDELAERGLPVTASGDAWATAAVGDLRAALEVRTAYAAYAAVTFAAPRPKALLGDANLRQIHAAVADVLALHRPGSFAGLRLSAAGAGTPVMRRLAASMADAAGLPVDDDDGDLLVRVVPSWQVLIRLTPRPLSDRPWHVPGFEGALDASVAAAMVRLSRPRPDDVFLDPTCGSGTIAVERARHGPAAAVLAGDIDVDALVAAWRNGAGALLLADAASVPLRAGSVTALAANPPWGHRFEADDAFGGALLAEAGRVAVPGARFAVLTHDVRRFEQAVRDQSRWHVEQQLRLDLRGHHPRLYVLV